jgi:hypothetical protein
MTKSDLLEQAANSNIEAVLNILDMYGNLNKNDFVYLYNEYLLRRPNNNQQPTISQDDDLSILRQILSILEADKLPTEITMRDIRDKYKKHYLYTPSREQIDELYKTIREQDEADMNRQTTGQEQDDLSNDDKIYPTGEKPSQKDWDNLYKQRALQHWEEQDDISEVKSPANINTDHSEEEEIPVLEQISEEDLLTVNNKKLLKRVFFKEEQQPSDLLLSRFFIKMLPAALLEQANHSALNLPFIYNHVAGDPKNSPNRGVCVQIKDKKHFDRGSWTLSKNKSNCTLVTNTVIMEDGLKQLIPHITDVAKTNFDTFKVSDGNFALFVANKYNKGTKEKINPHTDDQAWYPDPAVFASVTFFPEGEPENPLDTFRFKIRDPETNKYIEAFLPHGSVCLMCANIEHQVVPPANASNSIPRINLTYRNLIDPKIDPVGYLIGISNHFRYYGIPNKAIIPKDVYSNSKDEIDSILYKYKSINNELQVDIVSDTSDRKKRKNIIKNRLREKYTTQGLTQHVTPYRGNVVLELLEDAYNYINQTTGQEQDDISNDDKIYPTGEKPSEKDWEKLYKQRALQHWEEQDALQEVESPANISTDHLKALGKMQAAISNKPISGEPTAEIVRDAIRKKKLAEGKMAQKALQHWEEQDLIVEDRDKMVQDVLQHWKEQDLIVEDEDEDDEIPVLEQL